MRHFCITLMIVIFLISFAYADEGKQQNTKEFQALSKLPKGAYGYIIWESNRDGDWEIYRMEIPSAKIQKITDNNVHDRNARISDDGKLIAWTRGDNYKHDVWIMNADGTDQRTIIPNASMGIWRSDGKLAIHHKKDNASFIYDLDTKNETKIWSLDNVKIEPNGVENESVSPSPDGKMIVAWAGNPRGTWIFSSDGKFQKHIHGGCEGSFAPDGSFVYWVMTAGIFGKATLEGVAQEPLYKLDGVEYGHTYFPRLSKNMDYLIFGACPNNQHDHDTSDYEIFLMKMEDLKPAWDKPIRLTYDPNTDRWADIFIQFDDTPPDIPLHVKAVANGQSIKLSWDKAQDAESEVLWYNVYRGTNKEDQQFLAKVNSINYTDYATNGKTTYQYTINAINSASLESQKSKHVTIKTKDSKPIPPINLVVNAGNRQAILKWSINPELDIKGYNVYRSLESKGKYAKINKKIVPEPSYIDESVEIGNTYHYYITAIDKAKHESQQSEIISRKIMERAKDGLLSLYIFDEGKGNIINDISGVNPALNLHIQNTDSVSWAKDEKAIEFTDNGMIISEGNADKLFNGIKDHKELSIELWFSPSNLTQNGPARIVSMSQDTGQRNFTLGQIGEDIAFRLRTTKTDQNGTPELDTKKHILSQQPTHIIATYDGNVKRLYINGSLHSESQEIIGDFGNWTNYPLILGNELTGDRTWLGKIYLVAIYNRSLDLEEIIKNYQAGF